MFKGDVIIHAATSDGQVVDLTEDEALQVAGQLVDAVRRARAVRSRL